MARYFASNLTYYRVAAGLSMAGLMRASGVSQANIGRYERGETQEPEYATLEKLGAALGVTVDQLVKEPPPEVLPPGTPPQARSVTPVEPAPPLPTPTPPPRGLFPRDGRILRFLQQAGASPEGGETWLAQEASVERYVVQAIGNCLEPHVYENDLLVLDVDRAPTIGDIVVVNAHGELHVKVVMDRTGSGLYLTSKRGDLSLPEEGAELIGVVIDVTRPVPKLAMGLGTAWPPGWRPERPSPRTTVAQRLPPDARSGADDD